MDRKESWNRFLTPARKEDLQSLYEEVMGKASSPGAQTEEKPFYFQAAEIRGAAKGISTDQLLASYSERLRNFNYPTPECLIPDDVQACVSGELLSTDRLQHAENCEGCRNLLGAVQPAPGVVVELMEEVRLMTAQFSGRTRAVAAGSEDSRSQAMTLRTASALFYR